MCSNKDISIWIFFLVFHEIICNLNGSIILGGPISHSFDLKHVQFHRIIGDVGNANLDPKNQTHGTDTKAHSQDKKINN